MSQSLNPCCWSQGMCSIPFYSHWFPPLKQTLLNKTAHCLLRLERSIQQTPIIKECDVSTRGPITTRHWDRSVMITGLLLLMRRTQRWGWGDRMEPGHAWSHCLWESAHVAFWARGNRSERCWARINPENMYALEGFLVGVHTKDEKGKRRNRN